MEASHSHPMAPRKYRTSANNPIWMDGLRILLGLFLFIKGISFLNNSSDVFYLLSQQESLAHLRKASNFFSFFHIIGGLMIAFGFLTRFALLVQIPILLGAVFIVNTQNGLELGNVELWVSAAVLALMLFFMIVGPGRYSVDHRVLRHKPSEV